MSQPVPAFRFAPSPNGHLHLGHALSALLNARAAAATHGRLLLRIENIDEVRCTPELEAEMMEDLAWLGLAFEPGPMRQSERFDSYAAALKILEDKDLTYRGYLTRGEIKRFVTAREAQGDPWLRDPDGAPLYPGDAQVLSDDEIARRQEEGAPHAVRLNMTAALRQVTEALSWWEGPAEGAGISVKWMEGRRIVADPAAWGDVVLARKDCPTSYHLSVVVDDADQGISDVIRGQDLFYATAVHRLLQHLLGLPEPRYRHHQLLLDEDGQKLSKSTGSTGLRQLRNQGVSFDEVLRIII